MMRTVARDLMFWKGRVQGVPLGVVMAWVSRERMEDRGRGGIEGWEHWTGRVNFRNGGFFVKFSRSDVETYCIC